MFRERLGDSWTSLRQYFQKLIQRGSLPAVSITIGLACIIGIATGYGAVLFSLLINAVGDLTVRPILGLGGRDSFWLWLLLPVPALGLLAVSWFTRRYAPEAQGHGVPEVILAVA